MDDPDARAVISFRRLLATEVMQFVTEERVAFEPLVPTICELIILLSRYREEGAALFPQVFIFDNLEAAMARLSGFDRVQIGSCRIDPDSARRALKRTAPIGRVGWSTYFHVTDQTFSYGVFRTDGFVLAPNAMERLRTTPHTDLQIVGVTQLEDSVVELRAGNGSFRHVFLSGARIAEPGPGVVDRFVRALAVDSPDALRTGVQNFWRRCLVDSLRMSHGTLVAVIDHAPNALAHFTDAAHLTPPIDVAAHVGAYLDRHDETTRAAVYGASTLALGMLGADGITVVRHDGALLAYNAFVGHAASPGSAVSGGARRRTFETLASEVGRALIAAYYRSQDGATAVALAPT